MTNNTHSKVFTETTLQKKLGVVEEMKIFTINAPDNYVEMLGDLPEGVEILTKTDRKVDMVHIFASSKETLKTFLKVAVRHVYSMGSIWVSWPRNEETTPLSKQTIKLLANHLDLKDEKSVIVDEFWDGVMFRFSN